MQRVGVSFRNSRPHLPRCRSTTVLATSIVVVSISRWKEEGRSKQRVRKRGGLGNKGSARVAFTSRHQRNCMRGNKQNYKALAGPDYFSASSLLRVLLPCLSPSVSFSPRPFFSSPLFFSLLSFFTSWKLLEPLLALLSLRLPESKNARVRLTHM